MCKSASTSLDKLPRSRVDRKTRPHLGPYWISPAERTIHVNEMLEKAMQLHQSIGIQPLHQTASFAHWLTSSALILGYPKLAAALGEIEKEALQGEIKDRGRNLLDAIMNAFPDQIWTSAPTLGQASLVPAL